MTASRARALSSRAPFRRGGLLFSAARVAVEIPADHPLGQVLAILREPVLTIQVDEEGDGVFVTMKPAAREAAIAHLAARLAGPDDYLSELKARLAALNTPEEQSELNPAGDPAGGAGAAGSPTADAPTPLEAAIDATAQAGAVTTASPIQEGVQPAVEPATAEPSQGTEASIDATVQADAVTSAQVDPVSPPAANAVVVEPIVEVEPPKEAKPSKEPKPSKAATGTKPAASTAG